MDAYRASLIFGGKLPKGVEQLPNGETQGAYPNSPQALAEIGHTKRSMLGVIRAKCLDCSHTANEVRKCVSTGCPLWPYRMGTNPFRAERTEAQMAVVDKLKLANNLAS
jgi:hypothetical protein